MKYQIYYYKNKPLIALPLNKSIYNLYPKIKDKIRFSLYKKRIQNIDELIDISFREYFQEAIIYFHKNKIIIKDIEENYICILGNFDNQFYRNYEKNDFKSFKLPKLYGLNEKMAVFKYIKDRNIRYSYEKIYLLSKEIFTKLGYSHGDFHKSNLIYDDEIYIIDWDDIGVYTPNYDFIHFFMIDVFRKFEKKTKDRFDFYKKIKKDLLNFVTIKEIEKTIEIISKKRNFKGFK